MPKSASRTDSPRVDRARLSQTVFSQLSRAIIAGEFEPGSRVSEPTLSTMLGVSRALIREARIELELRGLVEFDPTVNKATGLVNDVPGEIMPTPNLWGSATLAGGGRITTTSPSVSPW